MAKKGSNSKYTPQLLKETQELASALFNDKEIYDYLGISHDTFYLYKKTYPEFSEVISSARKEAKKRIITSALEKASTDNYMQIFFLKNKCGYMETQQRRNLKIKHLEYKLKEKEFKFKSNQFLTKLAEEFGLDKVELSQFADKHFYKADDK